MQALSKQVQTLSFLLGTPLIKTSIVIIPDTSGSESASLYPTAELQRDFLLLELYALAVWTARYVLKNSFS